MTTHTASKERNGTIHPRHQLSPEKWSIHNASLSSMSNPLHRITNQELFEKHLCNQSSHCENMDKFHYKGKPSCATAKSTPFAVSKMNWTQRRMPVCPWKNVLYILWYAKRHVCSWSDVEQWKNQACSLSCYCVWRHQSSQSVSQSVTQSLKNSI